MRGHVLLVSIFWHAERAEEMRTNALEFEDLTRLDSGVGRNVGARIR